MKKKYLLNTDAINEILHKNKIVVIDGGARGEIFKPFNLLNKNILQVIRFEPDPDATVVNTSDNDLIIRKALWKNDQEINVNIAYAGSTSSVYPFNRDLQKYIDPHYEVRKTKKVVVVDAVSLDTLKESKQIPPIDFIKLDIHGAEFEVLEGAKEVLKNTQGLLIESWILPIHKGQKVRSNVEALAFDKKFYVFEEYRRSEWTRMSTQYAKKQPVAVDTLFFKDPLLDNSIKDQIQAIKLIGLSELFGHDAYASQLTDYFESNKILDLKWHQFIKQHLIKNRQSLIKVKILKTMENLSKQLFDTCTFK